MISKAEREKDKAICEAATAGEWQECGHSVFVAGSQGEPRADWVANVWYPRLPHDRAAIANASGPLSRTMAMAPSPGAVAMATMVLSVVSRWSLVVRGMGER